jgi:hypothetical protein
MMYGHQNLACRQRTKVISKKTSFEKGIKRSIIVDNPNKMQIYHVAGTGQIGLSV